MRRLRRILLVSNWSIAAMVLGYLLVYGYGALMRAAYGASFDGRELFKLHATATLIVGGWMLIHGIRRGGGYHPASNKEYGAWLEQTPWRAGVPLPLGPATLWWQDAVLLALVLCCVTLNALSYPIFHADVLRLNAHVAGAFTVGYTLGALGALASCKQWREWIILLILLPLMLMNVLDPVRLMLVSAAILVVATVGIRRSLARFPWPRKEPPSPVATLGWPFDKLAPSPTDPGVPPGRGLLAGAIIGWWVYCIAQVASDRGGDADRVLIGMCCFGVGALLALGRIARYCGSYNGPIPTLARLWLGRLIIPRYDYVFIAPLATIAVSIAAPAILWSLGLTPPVAFAVSIALVFAAVLELGPTFEHWRLTGAYRMSAVSRRAPALSTDDD